MSEPENQHVPLIAGAIPHDPIAAADAFLDSMRSRRTVRHFSDRTVPQSLIERIVATAGTAPSGANKQPWKFVAIQDRDLKRAIRIAAEDEERQFYDSRANEKWLRDLDVLGTNDQKPFLEEAPWLVAVFRVMRDDEPDRASDQVYYVNESVGIAVGILLAAIRQAGLCSLTHTPSPIKFLGPLLGRPSHERPFIIIPVGYPTDDCVVPDLTRKTLDRIMILDEGSPLRPEGSTEPLPDLSPPRSPGSTARD